MTRRYDVWICQRRKDGPISYRAIPCPRLLSKNTRPRIAIGYLAEVEAGGKYEAVAKALAEYYKEN